MPTLILYHPSRAVVLRALKILEKSGRVDFVPIADRLIDSADPEIRAAAVLARSTIRPEASALRRAAEDPSPLVRATGIVGLVAGGWASDDTRQIMDDLLRSSSVDTQEALARAIERQPVAAFEDVILRLAASPDSRVLRHVAHAMAKIKSPSFLPTLLPMLGQREVRNETRAALLRYGQEALRMLTLRSDDHLPRHVRQIPIPLSICTHQAAPSCKAASSSPTAWFDSRSCGRWAAWRPTTGGGSTGGSEPGDEARSTTPSSYSTGVSISSWRRRCRNS